MPSWENPNTNTLEQSKAGPFSTLSSFHGLTLQGLRLGDGGWVSLFLECEKVRMGSPFLCPSVFLWLYSSFASLAGWDWVLFFCFFPSPRDWVLIPCGMGSGSQTVGDPHQLSLGFGEHLVWHRANPHHAEVPAVQGNLVLVQSRYLTNQKSAP